MIALMLMVFLVLLMTSLASLVRVDFQSANAANSQSLARQNALLGLQIALAQLQEHTGSDLRSTAQSSILETGPVDEPTIANPYWTGVWRANAAGTEAELATWLVSGNQSLAPADADFVAPANALPNTDSVEILGAGTTSTDAVRVPLVEIENGNFAYWVSEQQTKALINIGKENAVAPALPQTISSRHLFPHLGLSVAPEESESVHRALTFPQVSQALSLTAADKQVLSASYHDVTIASEGLLTDAKRGGLRVDLSALLSAPLPAAYSGEPIYEAPAEIRADAFATQPPTWDYLKSYYDLRLEVLNNGGVTPRPSSPGVHGVSPVIAMFSYGFAGGLDFDNRVLVNLYPRLVLYNPYNVTLKAKDYLLVLFGNQPLRNEGAFATYEFRYMPIAEGLMNTTFHSVGINYEMGKSFAYSADGTQSDLAQRTDIEGPGAAPTSNPPGAPRFLVEAPDIAPGEAVIFTPASQSDYDRYANANPKLTPGLRPHSFRWHTRAYLKEDPSDPALTDSIVWNIHGSSSMPVYIDAALAEVDSNADVIRADTTGVQRHLYRRDADAFSNNIYQLTGRIPARRPSPAPTSTTYYYNNPNPNPGIEFGWSAYAFTPTASIHTRPYAHFNPRAKDLDPRNIRDSNGDNQHHFYTAYTGTNLQLPDTYDGNQKVYIGGDYTQSGGTRSFVLYDIPQDEVGLYSLGQLQHLQVSERYDEPGYAIGNAWASPHIDRDKTYKQGAGATSAHSASGYRGDVDYSAVDISYLLNDALWDRYFFSSIRNIGQEGSNAFHQPQNPRYHFSDTLAATETLSDPTTNAAKLHVNGAFNVNSTSVAAWRALLSGLHGIAVDGNTLEYPFFRSPHPTGTSGDLWAGFRELSDTQIEALAKAIVAEIKARGPFTSLADFVNRRLIAADADTDGHGLKGALQAAIDATDINNSTPGVAVTQANTLAFDQREHAAGGDTADGIPGFLSQADILSAIGPMLTTRSDTFIIRSYGDALNPATGQIEGRAWCEAVVQRAYDYVNPGENAPADPTDSLSAVNARLGREYRIISFRWLQNDEV